MRRFLWMVSLVIFVAGGLQGQIWPGDVNDNGRVNGVDVLWWAYAAGAEGPNRLSPSAAWSPQDAPADWPLVFPSGRNYAYADANGDGEVDLFDLFTIEINELNSHGVPTTDAFSTGDADSPALHFGVPMEPTIRHVVAGEAIELPLYVGTEEQPVNEVFGVSFLVYGDSDFLLDVGIRSNAGDWRADRTAWNQLSIDEDLVPAGLFGSNFTWFHLAGETAAGHGRIGALEAIIVEDLSFLTTDTTVLVIVEPFQMLDGELALQGLYGDTLMLRVFPDSLTLLQILSREEEVRASLDLQLYPNPHDGACALKWKNEDLERIELLNTTGQTLNTWRPTRGSREQPLQLQGLAAGHYFLQVRTRDGRTLAIPCNKSSP